MNFFLKSRQFPLKRTHNKSSCKKRNARFPNLSLYNFLVSSSARELIAEMLEMTVMLVGMLFVSQAKVHRINQKVTNLLYCKLSLFA